MLDERLGAYRIESELGSGGMGKVFLAEAMDSRAVPVGTRVALKVAHPHLLSEPGFIERFLREAEIGKTVCHPNVVRCHDCDQSVAGETTHGYLVMEYVEGQTLRDLLAELEVVPEELCRHIGREVSKGLAAIHGEGVIHRDIKPENVLITPDHEVKIMDLGVARLADELIRLSRSGAFVGSVHYASPEQFGGDELDGRADLFSLGVILYQLSSGALPHAGDNFMQVLAKVVEEEPRRLGERNPQLSAFFEEVVHSLLLKNPKDRVGSATALEKILVQGEESTWWGGRLRALQEETKCPVRRIRIPRETAVYGRDEELGRLRALYEKAKSGEGQVVLFEGEAGIGKTRLVDELIGELQAAGEELNFLTGSCPPGGAATAYSGFSAAFREHLGEAGSADHLSGTPLLSPAFDALLRGEPAPTGSVELTPTSLNTCFVHAARSIAAERTTIVLIDDLHFAPDEARDTFTSVALGVPENRLLLIGTARPGVPDAWLANISRLDHAWHHVLKRLGPKDLTHLLKDAFQSEKLAHELGMKIAEKSDGNPFFVFEIVRGLRDGQFIRKRADGTWVSTRVIGEIQIPSTVLDLVNARVADLSEGERDLLDVACCWGYEFDPSLIGEVLGLARIPTLKRFSQIERAHRLVRSSGRRYAFDHHQVQEALYRSLHEQLREEYHSALADALEARTNAADGEPDALDGALCVSLSEHFLRGGRGEAALRYLKTALRHLGRSYATASALELGERALAVKGLLTGEERARVLISLCDLLDRMGRREQQEEFAREAVRLSEEAENQRLLGRAARVLGILLWRTSRNDEAEEAFHRALAISVAEGNRGAEGKALVNLGLLYQFQDRLEEAVEYCERARDLFRDIGDRRGEGAACGNLGLIRHAQGRVHEGLDHVNRQLALCRAVGDRELEGTAEGSMGTLLRTAGHIEESLLHHERHLTISREIGNRLGEVHAISGIGGALWSQGRIAEARGYLERFLELCRELGDRRTQGYALQNLGYLHCDLGETAKGLEYVSACIELCEETGTRHLEAQAHLTEGSVRSALSGGQAGRESLEAARDLAAEIGVPGIETMARCELALLPGARPDEAVQAFEENVEHLTGDERREGRLLLWKASGDPAHLDEAKRLLDEAVAHVSYDIRASMLENIRVNREVMAAWEDLQGAN